MKKLIINWRNMSPSDLEAELCAEKQHRMIFDHECDLFHEGVPTKRIVEILDVCARVVKHDYVFLTSNPERFAELDTLALLPRRHNFYYCAYVRGDTLKVHLPEIREKAKECE